MEKVGINSFQFHMLRQNHTDKIDQEMGKHNSFYVAVFEVINTKNNPDKEGKYQLVQTIIPIVQGREQQ